MLLSYTLLSDGSSDKVLLPILDWLLRSHLGEHITVNSQWADLSRIDIPSRRPQDQIPAALSLFPCDLLFVHRDVEKESMEVRKIQLDQAITAIKANYPTMTMPPIVYILPRHMTEAWLLFNEKAIRTAAGNPNGEMQLDLPDIRRVEGLPDPKKALNDLLILATGLSARRRKSVPISYYASLVSGYIDDFSPLRQVFSFRTLEENLIHVIQENGWDR
jgi:hypothetical protein